MSSAKKTVTLLICLALLLTGCKRTNRFDFGGNGTSADDLMETAEICVGQGERFTELLMDETAAYFYGFAASIVSSMRLAAERLLWLKGEGANFEEVAGGSRYTDWDTIGELCFASPYPYYFEGLIYDVQGESEKADEAYSRAAVMTNFPDEGLDFYYLKDLSVSELYKLRDELRKEENEIYGAYSPVIYGYERSVYASSAEYLFADAYDLLENENYEAAMIPARYAVRQNPKSEDNWALAITAAVCADKPHQAFIWLEEGLKYFPDSEKLGNFKKAMETLGE